MTYDAVVEGDRSPGLTERDAGASTPTSGFTVTVPAPSEVWEEMALADPGAVVSQSLAWRDCVCADGTYRDVSRLYELRDRKILLPLVRRHRAPSWRAAHASWPKMWGVGGPIVERSPAGDDEVRAVLGDLARHSGIWAELRLRPGLGPAWISEAKGFRSVPHCMQVLDLDGGFDRVWKSRYSRSARNAVRKAEGFGLDVEVAKADEGIGVYNELFEVSLTRWARQQHEPRRLTAWRMRQEALQRQFVVVAQRFGARCQTWVALHQGTPLAAVVVLFEGGHAKAWKSAMDKDLAGPVHAGDLLHHLIIEDACSKGIRAYDFGESRPGSPLERFKSKFGAATYSAPELIMERIPIVSINDLSRRAAKRALRFVDY